MTSAGTRTRFAYLLLILMPALWSVNYIVARRAPGVVEPHMLALGRWSLAGAILCIATRAELWQHRATLQREWPRYLALGTLGMLICGAWVYIAGQSTSTMNMALIYAAAPVLIMIGSVLWLGERMVPLQIAGTVLSIAGVLHVVLKGRWNTLGSVQFTAGDLWIVAATIGWAAYALLLRKWPSPLSAPARLAATSVAGVLVLLPFALREAVAPAAPAWSTAATVLIVVAAVFPGLLAFWAYGHAQQVLGASRVASSLYVAPLFAALAAWLVLGETMQAFHLVGGALILVGLAATGMRKPFRSG